MNSWPRSLCARRSVVNDRTSPLEEFPSVSRGPRARGRRSCASNGFFLAARHHFLAEIYRCLEALVDTHAREIQRLAHSFPAPPTRRPPFLFGETSDKRPRARFSGSFVTPADSAPISFFMPVSPVSELASEVPLFVYLY